MAASRRRGHAIAAGKGAHRGRALPATRELAPRTRLSHIVLW
jgi:hypothetical protein